MRKCNICGWPKSNFITITELGELLQNPHTDNWFKNSSDRMEFWTFVNSYINEQAREENLYDTETGLYQ